MTPLLAFILGLVLGIALTCLVVLLLGMAAIDEVSIDTIKRRP